MQPPQRLLNATDHIRSIETSEFDLRHSFGPFLGIAGKGYLLDCTTSGYKPILGFNASPLFGTVHHHGAWSRDTSAHNNRLLKTALLELANRSQSSLTNRLTAQQLDRLANAVNRPNAEINQISQTYITLSVLEQYQDQMDQIAESIPQPLHRLAMQFPELISNIQTEGMTFAIQLQTQNQRERLIADRFDYGLNFERKGEDGIHFELDLACRQDELEILWLQLESLLQHAKGTPSAPSITNISKPASVEQNYIFAECMLKFRLHENRNKHLTNATQTTVAYLKSYLDRRQDSLELIPVVLTQENYADYRNQILALQTDIYEPARQTSAAEFDAVFKTPAAVAILLLSGGKIAAMGLAGPITHFPQVRGVSTDPFCSHPETLYMVDVTVREEFRGGIGKLVKQSITFLALQQGFKAIHGRNRDHLARGMWSINLSLGSFELQHLVNDYPDQGEFRDCIYYRCPLDWPDDDSMKSVDLESAVARLPNLIHGVETNETPPVL